MTLDRQDWTRASSADRERLARQLGRALPLGFEYAGLRRNRLGNVENEVALFTFDGASFVLAPGGESALGYDVASWEPSADEEADWQAVVEEYGFKGNARDFVSQVVGPPRKAVLSSLLVETEAREIGWEPMPLDHPWARQVARDCYGEGVRGWTSPNGPKGPVWYETGRRDSTERIRMSRLPGGRLSAYLGGRLSRAAIARTMAQDGFRLPTGDEWERLCGGGATTLWRWGDHAPVALGTPGTVSDEARRWRQDANLQPGSFGRFQRVPEALDTTWNLHRRPNASGLYIAYDTYQNELVAELDQTRGGDGGGFACGAISGFFVWLVLATAAQPQPCKPDAVPTLRFEVGRRVLPLT